jgi:hypothetical protein
MPGKGQDRSGGKVGLGGVRRIGMGAASGVPRRTTCQNLSLHVGGQIVFRDIQAQGFHSGILAQHPCDEIFARLLNCLLVCFRLFHLWFAFSLDSSDFLYVVLAPDWDASRGARHCLRL